jgi:hypothetical protein
MATWRHFARRTFPAVVRELRLPAATSRRDIDTCPMHDEPIGPVTRLCDRCFHLAWDEVGRRYSLASQGAGGKENTMHEPDPVEILEGEIVDDNDNHPAVQQTSGLFLTSDPNVFLARASEAATALARVIRDRKLFTSIRGKDHVHVEGWTLLGSLLGVFPITEWTRPVDEGWEARVAARTRSGELVGAAEAMCLRTEARWRNADAYAIRSMAATRATSKALRLPLGFVMELAGFDTTPAEEMPVDDAEAAQPRSPIPDEAKPTKAQAARISELLARLAEQDPAVDWKARCRELVGVSGNKLTRGGAMTLIRELEQLAEVAT